MVMSTSCSWLRMQILTEVEVGVGELVLVLVLVLVVLVLVLDLDEEVDVGAGEAPVLGRYLMPLELHDPCSGASMGLQCCQRQVQQEQETKTCMNWPSMAEPFRL
jgi:hypothetical protein